MAHITADRVRETSTTTGTGVITVAGAVVGFRTFASVLATNDTCYYAIASYSLSEWEVGIGTYSALNTITRTTVIASSNAGAAVNFSAGVKDVFLTSPASRFLQADTAGSYGNFTAGTITASLSGNATTVTNGVYTSRTISTTSPISGGGDLSANRTLSLASGYGDTQNPYASKTANFVLAAPDGTAGVPSFRALTNTDIPNLTGKTYNALSLTANATGFSVAGGTTSKTLTVNNSITLAGTDATTITLPATTGTVALNNQTFFLGTTSIAINRASANIALTGITSIDGNAATVTNGVYTTNSVLVARTGVADTALDTTTATGIYLVSYTGFSKNMLVWNTGGSTGITQFEVNYGNTGEIRLRNQTDSTTWSAWRTFLTNYNYNSYSPTLTGTGASGTWGISVTGNAATVTNLLLSTATNITDTVANNAIGYVAGISLFAQTDGALYSQYYSANWQHQIFGDYRTGQIAIRGKNNGTWQAWRTVLDSSNYSSYAAPTNQTMYIGTTAVAINRASAALSLTGITSIDGSAATWTTARTLTIGATGKSVNGSANVSWSLAELGAASTSQTMYIGTTPVAINRTSGALSLTGTSIDGASGQVGSFDPDRTLATHLPSTYPSAVRFQFANATATGTGGNYAGVMTYSPWSGTTASTGDASYQLAFGSSATNGSGTPQLRIRNGIDSTWNSWYDIISGVNNSSLNADSRNTRGVTRLYRRDDNSDYSVQTNWTGTRWLLRGYTADTFHAECEVAYATSAGSATNATNVSGGTVSGSSVNGSYIGVNNTTNTNGYGISLYNGATAGVPAYGLMFQGTATFGTHGAVTSDWATYFTMNNTANRGWIFRDVSTPTNVASISNNGTANFNGNVTAYYSDARLKTFTGKIQNAVEKVCALNGYYYVENETAKSLGYTNDKVQVGVSAQEVQAVLPEIVTEAPASKDYLTIWYEKLTPLLIEAIKEQQETIDSQEQRIAKLEAALEKLING